MSMKRKLKLNQNFVTYGIALGAFVILQIMVLIGAASRQMQSLLVPCCINIILAVSLNLVVGVLGELSLGHAGFMSVGAYAGCLFAVHMEELLRVQLP